MSLTSILERRGTPLRELFEEQLPNLKFMQAAWREAGPPTVLPPPGVNLGLIGAALDYHYRIRYLWALTPIPQFVAAGGAFRRNVREPFGVLANSLNGFLQRNDPRGALLEEEAEGVLAQFCYLLAMYESVFRAPVHSPVLELSPSAPLSEQLAWCQKPLSSIS